MATGNLPFLAPAQATVDVQRTSLSLDVLGRFVCNRLDEAVRPGPPAGPPFDLTADFDAVVIGSGMYGAYCAARLYRNGAKALVLEAGPFLVSEHTQNLSDIGLGVGDVVNGELRPDTGADQVSAQVWGLPWRGNQVFGRLAFCVGGKSLFWGGWAPRLTDDVLAGALNGGAAWPPATADYLRTIYERIELQMGVKELVPGAAAPQTRTDFFNSDENRLTAALRPRLEALVGTVSGNGGPRNLVERIEDAPLAVQADAPGSGLFSFDKFASLPVLVEAIRDDVGRSRGADRRRRLFLVPDVRVLRLFTTPDGASRRVTGIEVFDGATVRILAVPTGCAVVLALSAIESTRLALESFGTPLMGRNLQAHLRNNVTMRIRRSALGIEQQARLQTAAFHIAGKATTGGRYHLQFYAGYQPGPNAEAVLYRMVPDIESVLGLLRNQDPEWVSITFRGIGEMEGDPNRPVGDDGASYVGLSGALDQHGRPRAWVNLVQQPRDLRLFDEMEAAIFSLAARLAKGPGNIEYFDEQEKRFRPDNPYAPGTARAGKLKSEGGIRDPLGTTYHDSGTLWMGADASSSVTDPTGRFHHVTNAYCADQALFPRGGSANPVPTGLALARRTAETIANEGLQVAQELDARGQVAALHHAPEPGFEPLFVFDTDALLPRGWRHVGPGGFVRIGLGLETDDGIGVLCYTAVEFEDFTLRLQWRAPTVENNSGVYVRLPRGLVDDPARLIKTGYEVQIDNTGERPADQDRFPFPQAFFERFHQTGAIYPVHPFSRDKPDFPPVGALPFPNGHPSIQPIPTRALSQWNDLEIRAAGNRLRVFLNGTSVLVGGEYVDQRSAYPRGLIGLQNHFKGARVQFRHVRVRRGTPPA